MAYYKESKKVKASPNTIAKSLTKNYTKQGLTPAFSAPRHPKKPENAMPLRGASALERFVRQKAIPVPCSHQPNDTYCVGSEPQIPPTRLFVTRFSIQKNIVYPLALFLTM